VTVADAIVGTRVRVLRDFSVVPAGTEGTIDEIYDGGCMVAWDLPGNPLPKGWPDTGRRLTPGRPLRDGWGIDDLEFLEVVAGVAGVTVEMRAALDAVRAERRTAVQS